MRTTDCTDRESIVSIRAARGRVPPENKFVGANADTIWEVPAYLPYLQPPLTDRALAEAEHQIGFTLPGEYLALLRKQNGGYIRFSLPEMVHDSIAGIGPHFPSITDIDWDECQEYVSFGLSGLVPFDGDGHWHLCLDYRKNSNTPCITYVDIECDRECQVADSFLGYLAKLQLTVEDEYVLEGVADVRKVQAALSSALRTRFEPPTSWEHGYPIYRARLGEENNPEWVWLSPNVVPRGFVREDDPRYEELKDLMPGQAVRFPEVPAASYLLSATDGVRSSVTDACARARLAIRPLREYLDAT
jgi:SMI1/KNR4 family protein SUKH-1